MKDILGSKIAAIFTMVWSFTILNSLNIEYGILGSIFQIAWILAGYLFYTKEGKKRNLPPLYYFVSSILSFVLCIFLTDPIHSLLLKKYNWNLSIILICSILAFLSEYTFEIVTSVRKMFMSLMPVLREFLANKIKPKE